VELTNLQHILRQAALESLGHKRKRGCKTLEWSYWKSSQW